MSFCPKCGNKVAEGNLYCTACGTKLEGVGPTEEKELVVSPEEKRVKRERGNNTGVAFWAILSAIGGALCGIAAAFLGAMGLNQQYDLARYSSWVDRGGGLPPGASVAAVVLSTVSIIFIAMAIALGIYALHSSRKE